MPQRTADAADTKAAMMPSPVCLTSRPPVALSATGGREVKHTGDGIMAAFVSAASAVRCGINVQQKFSHHRKENPDQPLKVRIGVAAGEPIEHHNDFFGSTVQLAARL